MINDLCVFPLLHILFFCQVVKESPTSLVIQHTSPFTYKTTLMTFQLNPPAAPRICKIWVGLCSQRFHIDKSLNISPTRALFRLLLHRLFPSCFAMPPLPMTTVCSTISSGVGDSCISTFTYKDSQMDVCVCDVDPPPLSVCLCETGSGLTKAPGYKEICTDSMCPPKNAAQCITEG